MCAPNHTQACKNVESWGIWLKSCIFAQDWPPRHERCEDPVFAKEKGLTLDLEYYLLNQVAPMLFKFLVLLSGCWVVNSNSLCSWKPLFCHFWSLSTQKQIRSSRRQRVRIKQLLVHVTSKVKTNIAQAGEALLDLNGFVGQLQPPDLYVTVLQSRNSGYQCKF
jgi:hypothetical protein